MNPIIPIIKTAFIIGAAAGLATGTVSTLVTQRVARFVSKRRALRQERRAAEAEAARAEPIAPNEGAVEPKIENAR